MKKGIIFLLVCLHVTYACNSSQQKIQQKESDKIVFIPVFENLKNTQPIKLSSIASDIEYIALETSNHCLIDRNTTVHAFNNYLVSVGGDQNNQNCFVFERKTGNFVRKISREGRGPGEYQEVMHFFRDTDNEQICVFGNNQYIFFNLDGSFSHTSKKFEHRMSQFIAYEDFYVGFCTNYFGIQDIRVAFYDKTGSLVEYIPNHRSYEKIYSWWGGGNDGWLYSYDKNLYFKDLYCDTLFHIKDFSLFPRYIFDTGGLTVPYEEQEGGRYDIMAEIEKGKLIDKYEKYIHILKIFEDQKNLYFTIEHRQKRYPALYQKLEKELQIAQPVSIILPTRRQKNVPWGLENDLDGGLPFWPQQMISDKEMMCVYTAEELLELDKSKITDPSLKKVINSIHEESNPVVAIVTLK